MPHSSGGGGGSFSHAGHSGGGHSKPSPNISHHPGQGTKHQYVVYHHYHPVYLYSDLPIGRSSYSSPLQIISSIVAMVGLFIGAVLLFGSYRFEPEPLEMDYNTDIIIMDDLGVLSDENELYDSMISFQELTGITPAFESVANITDDDELEDFAYDEYISMFDDESHWLLVYSEDNSSWAYVGMQGDDTDDLLDDYILDDFNDYVLTYLGDNRDVGDTLSLALDNTHDSMYDHGVVYPMMNHLGIACLITALISIAVFIYTIFDSRNDSFYEIRQKVSDNHVTAFCPNCHGEYVIDLHTTCPYCGASLAGNTDYKEENETFRQ